MPTIPVAMWTDRVVREAMVNFKRGARLDSCLIQILLFADDKVVMTQTKEDLNENSGRLTKEDLNENSGRLYEAMSKHMVW